MTTLVHEQADAVHDETDLPDPFVGSGLLFDPPGRGRIYDSVLETIGNTPLVRAKKLCAARGVVADLLLKLEYFNPLSSVKDRIGAGLILDLERRGIIKPGDTLVEPSSGNTGIGLAFVAAARGYRLILVMPEHFSAERRKMLKLLGAELVLTPAEPGIRASIEKTKELLKEIPGSVWPGQFDNPANPGAHFRTTAEEIWRDTGGRVDMIISGVGTGGTLTGCGRRLKALKPELMIVAVEPARSPALSKGGTYEIHALQGIGGGFVPENCDTSLIDEISVVEDADALATAREAALLEGLPIGISAGAALWSGFQIGRRSEMEGKQIVVIVPSCAERYLSTVLFDGV